MPKPKRSIDEIAEDIPNYDPESQQLFRSIKFTEAKIAELKSMKMTSGWKFLEKKIREELTDRINELVKDDAKVQVLLSLLIVADTKTQEAELKQTISEILPP